MQTKNTVVLDWINEMAAMTQPDRIVWIDGSEEQLEALRAEGCSTGELYKLNEEKLPGCYLHRTAQNDVARVEDRTFICCRRKEDAGPTNNWMAPDEMYTKLREALYRRHERAHHVCNPVFHGRDRFSFCQIRDRTHGFHLRRAQHGHHDQGGEPGDGGTGRFTRFCQGTSLQGAAE